MISEDTVLRFEEALLAVDWGRARDVLYDIPELPVAALEELMVPALERIGAGWEQGRVALSQVYMSGRICEQLVDEVLPLRLQRLREAPSMAIVVLQDRHMLGKRLVSSVLRCAGYSLSDYGALGVEALVQRVVADRPDILMISTLMLPSALRVKEVRARLDLAGCGTKFIVGGAPFRLDPDLWREVGASAMGYNASDILRLVGGNPEGRE